MAHILSSLGFKILGKEFEYVRMQNDSEPFTLNPGP